MKLQLTQTVAVLRKEFQHEDGSTYVSTWRFGQDNRGVCACYSNRGDHRYFSDVSQLRGAIAAWKVNGYAPYRVAAVVRKDATPAEA